jgi:hypothetical protein
MLFVDYDISELRESYFGREEGMGADNNVDMSGRQRLEQQFSGFANNRTCEERQTDPEWFEPFCRFLCMLAGEQFRRCHEGDLFPTFDNLQCRYPCDKGFSRTDIPL